MYMYRNRWETKFFVQTRKQKTNTNQNWRWPKRLKGFLTCSNIYSKKQKVSNKFEHAWSDERFSSNNNTLRYTHLYIYVHRCTPCLLCLFCMFCLLCLFHFRCWFCVRCLLCVFCCSCCGCRGCGTGYCGWCGCGLAKTREEDSNTDEITSWDPCELVLSRLCGCAGARDACKQ